MSFYAQGAVSAESCGSPLFMSRFPRKPKRISSLQFLYKLVALRTHQAIIFQFLG